MAGTALSPSPAPDSVASTEPGGLFCSTLEEFEAVSSRSHQRTELLRGKVVFMSPAGNQHGRVAGDIHGFLWQHVRKKKLGTLRAAETGFRLHHPDDEPGDFTVRAPDVAFLGNEKSKDATEVTFSEVVPDLVVEVHSPGDSVAAAGGKVSWWLACGGLAGR